jgi:hypothetical protein
MVVHWDGEKWQRIPPPPTLGASNLNAVLAIGPRNVWVVGGPGLVGGSPSLAAHWNGTEWTPYAMPGDPNEAAALDSVVRGPSNSIYAAGGSGMYVWSNGAWTAATYSFWADYIIDPIAARGGTFWGISGQYSGQVVRLDGSAWASVGKAQPGSWAQIAADSNGGAWAVGWFDPLTNNQEHLEIAHYHC